MGKKKYFSNRIKKIRIFMRKAIISAAVLGLVTYLVKAPKQIQKDNTSDWKRYGFEVKIAYNFTNGTTRKYYEGVQLIVPRKLQGQTDWHDYETMKSDLNREGHGEQGRPTATKTKYKSRNHNLFNEYGLNTVVSDLISIDRSVPDIRTQSCRKKRYLSKLPTVSIVIVCMHEYLSVLKRTLHSIVNRTPASLLHEIIIVHLNDERDFWRNLEKYANIKFPRLLKYVYINKTEDSISARLAGAKVASANVLLFLSPLVECNYNWLPPLLEPIAFDKHLLTLPVSDIISAQTFAYKPNEDTNRRVGFDWDLNHEYLPLLLNNGADTTYPYKDIIMKGEIFAIDRSFFWSLGGFDEGISNFVDALFEFSFKVWLCGGKILSVPCSHVGVIDLQWEMRLSKREENRKRIAEIWMDEYKKYVYAGIPEFYEAIDAGNLSSQQRLRDELKCRPFAWFLNAVAPDILEINPPIHKPDLAWGFLRLALYPELCIDANVYEHSNITGLNLCASIAINQDWRLSWRGNIQLVHRNLCLEVFGPPPNSTVYLTHCHYSGSTQTWSYEQQEKYLINSQYENACLDIIEMEPNWKVVLNDCHPDNVGMHWTFDNVNDVK